MPCHYKIFARENLIAKTYSGRITTRCVLKLLDDIEDDQNYREGMLEFDDLRDISDLAITASDIGHFADLIAGLNARKRQPTKKAILAPYGPARTAAFGFCKMVENAKGIEIEVFDETTEAFKYLGLPESGLNQRSLEMGLKVH